MVIYLWFRGLKPCAQNLEISFFGKKFQRAWKYLTLVMSSTKDRNKLCFIVNFWISLANWHKLVFNIWKSVCLVDVLDVSAGHSLNLWPSVDLNSHVFPNNIGMSISNCDESSFLDNIQLLIFGNHNGTSVFISNEAFCRSVDSSLISSSFSGNLDGLNLDVHSDSGSWLQLSHVYESWLLENDWLLWFPFFSLSFLLSLNALHIYK